MFHYAQIEKREDGYGYMVADSYLSGEVISENMIPITDPIDYSNHRWNYETEQWEEYTPDPAPEPTPTQPTNQDIMDKLDEMSAGQVSTVSLDAAYREGVNAYE